MPEYQPPTVRTMDADDELEDLARRGHETTPADVVNAMAAGTLDPAEVSDRFLALLELLPEDHPILNDDDPDDELDWAMADMGGQ